MAHLGYSLNAFVYHHQSHERPDHRRHCGTWMRAVPKKAAHPTLCALRFYVSLYLSRSFINALEYVNAPAQIRIHRRFLHIMIL